MIFGILPYPARVLSVTVKLSQNWLSPCLVLQQCWGCVDLADSKVAGSWGWGEGQSQPLMRDPDLTKPSSLGHLDHHVLAAITTYLQLFWAACRAEQSSRNEEQFSFFVSKSTYEAPPVPQKLKTLGETLNHLWPKYRCTISLTSSIFSS